MPPSLYTLALWAALAATVVHRCSGAPFPLSTVSVSAAGLNASRSSDLSATAATAIRQALSLFPVAIDLRDFDLLDGVFTPDATANFTGHSVFVGLPAITAYLAQGLEGLVSQHDLGTLYINPTGPRTATAWNWLQGNFWGTGTAANESLSYFGYYEDQLVESGGRWLVQNRVLGTFGIRGNESLVSALLDG